MRGLKILVGAVGILVLAGCAYRFVRVAVNVGLQTVESPALTVLEVLFIMLLSVIGIMFLHMSIVLWSDHHSLFSIFILYLLNVTLRLLAKFLSMKSFDKKTKLFRTTQEKLLLDALRKNKKTAYGKDLKFHEIHSLDEFKAKHPLTDYSHYKSYIDRICKGEGNVMTKDKVVRLTLTSGTTGKSKKIPYTQQTLTVLELTLGSLVINIVNADKRFKLQSPLQRNFIILCPSTPAPKEAGIPVGPIAMIEQSQKKFLAAVTTTPSAGYDIYTEFESGYVHMLFGICDRYIGCLESTFTPLLLSSFQVLEKHWQQMLNDLETGCISSTLNIPAEVRLEINKQIKARYVPERIQFLRREFEKGFVGIATRIWPTLQYFSGINLGTCNEELCRTYTKGLLEVSPAYAGTEGLFGVNLSLTPPFLYTLVPSAVIYEFIPVEQSEDPNPEIMFGDSVKVGEQYEMVVSNPTCGLYRFRFGDVIKVVDFCNATPTIEFQYRCGQILNLRGEKVDESAVYESILKCVKKWPNQRLVDFTSAESELLPDSERQTGPGYYVIFIEIDGKDGEYVLTADEKSTIESALCEQTLAYKTCREKVAIAPMDVRQVKPEGFAEFKKYIVDNSTASVTQFKQPRKLKTPEMLAFLLQNTYDIDSSD
ncbi:uncharacterized protein [Antedon mediterranea]|uniref:uncharacterized protein n=1 Tax=Antedon mediterranea TaxID=105859 RepID=UPI003AF8176D